MNQMLGSGSLCFSKTPFIISTASVVGKKEGEGPLKDCFDVIGQDEKFGEENWEAAESALQKEALALTLGKINRKSKDVRYLFAGDLLGQTIASSFGLKEFEIPMFGLYCACSTCGESLSLAGMTIAAGYADCVAAVTSSHFASAEKQFRFPLEYANQRPKSATWTVTGSGAFLLASEERVKEWKVEPFAKITGVTTGK
ncbi:MAG: stage V sporulation protein AD, partial [Agathobacter sp.]|nr:stage V sporulation protein AD [Agathobacter sp.]